MSPLLPPEKSGKGDFLVDRLSLAAREYFSERKAIMLEDGHVPSAEADRLAFASTKRRIEDEIASLSVLEIWLDEQIEALEERVRARGLDPDVLYYFEPKGADADVA